jgi:uncharacterized protein YdhG (YjbR/CyaY superfamily)
MNPIEAKDVDHYIAAFPEHTRALLEELRATIQETAPEAVEVISYKMPAYQFHGMLVYFAGYAKHIGFYPGAAVVEYFKDEVTKYKWAKGSVQFPLDKPLPLDFIKRVVQFRIQQNLEKAANKKDKKSKKT